jgi:hypothetical protein
LRLIVISYSAPTPFPCYPETIGSRPVAELFDSLFLSFSFLFLSSGFAQKQRVTTETSKSSVQVTLYSNGDRNASGPDHPFVSSSSTFFFFSSLLVSIMLFLLRLLDISLCLCLHVQTVVDPLTYAITHWPLSGFIKFSYYRLNLC